MRREDDQDNSECSSDSFFELTLQEIHERMIARRRSNIAAGERGEQDNSVEDDAALDTFSKRMQNARGIAKRRR